MYSAEQIAAMRNDPNRQREAVEAAIRRAGLDTSNGRVNIMVAGEAAWHGLGVRIEHATDSANAIKLAGMDWEVVKLPLTYEVNGHRHEAKGHFALVRADTGELLSNSGSGYQVIQNRESFRFLDTVLEEFGAKYEVAGSLFGGREVFMVCRLPEQSFTVNRNDRQEAYAVFTNPHVLGKSAKCLSVSQRPVCNNTLRLAVSGSKSGISIRHTGEIKSKIKDAQAALGLTVKQFSQYKEAAEAMTRTPINIVNYAHDVLDAVLDITQAQANMGANVLAAMLDIDEAERKLKEKEFSKKIQRRGEILEDILERYESEKNGVNGMRGTAWAGLNSVTEFNSHARIGRQASDLHERRSRRFESVMVGAGDEMNQVALQKAIAATRN